MNHQTELIQQLLTEARQRLVSVRTTQALGGGCINHAMRVVTSEGDYFAKWNDRGPADMFVREAECLKALAQVRSDLIIPEVIVATPSEHAPAMLITGFLNESQTDRKQQDATLGRGIAQLHRQHATAYGFDHDNYCGATLQDNQWNDDWVDFFGRQRIGHLVAYIEQRRGMEAAHRRTYEQLIHRLPGLIGHRPPPSLNHGDLWSGNYLYTDQGPALIDPASYYADREFDLALMRMFGGFSDTVWHAYREAYPLPADWRERQELYQLYHYLNHHYLFGGGYGQQALGIARAYL